MPRTSSPKLGRKLEERPLLGSLEDAFGAVCWEVAGTTPLWASMRHSLEEDLG